MKIGAEDVWAVVLDFIKTYLGEEELDAFKTHFNVTLDQTQDALVKAGGMQAMLQCFFKNNKKAYKQFLIAKKSKKESESGDEVADKKKDKKAKAKKAAKSASTLAGQKRKRSDSQVSDSPSVAKKRVRTESMNSAKSNGSTGGPVTRRKSLDAAEAVLKAPKPANEFAFKRIDPTKFANTISHKFADNSFEAKARFGTEGGDSYGSWSNSKLHDKKGASFIKEKNKMKNRQSHGSGAFNAMSVNSIKF